MMATSSGPGEHPLAIPPGVPFDRSEDDTAPDGTERVDGRRLRRERNREAVVDAILELYAQGNYSPSSEEIAEIAGISARSLFRYFDDLDDLVRTAIARQMTRLYPLAVIEIGADVPFSDRCTRFVRQRVALLEEVFELARAVRLRAPFQSALAEQLRVARNFFRLQLALIFAPELEALGPERSPAALAAIDVLCSFESIGLLRDDQGYGRREIDGILIRSIARLLEV